jgi:hypothetical protein
MKAPGFLAPLSAKLILGLSLALLASMAGNFLLVRSAWIAHGEAKGQKAREKLERENASLTRKIEIDAALAAQAKPQNEQLLADLRDIAERGQQTRVIYRQAAAKSPLAAVCVPGQARMDAVNAGLGPRKEPR